MITHPNLCQNKNTKFETSNWNYIYWNENQNPRKVALTKHIKQSLQKVYNNQQILYKSEYILKKKITIYHSRENNKQIKKKLTKKLTTIKKNISKVKISWRTNDTIAFKMD
jgi:hypothetical protein